MLALRPHTGLQHRLKQHWSAGHRCADTAARLMASVQSLQAQAAALVKAGDEAAARGRLEVSSSSDWLCELVQLRLTGAGRFQEKAAVHAAHVRAQERAHTNYRLAARLDSRVGA